MKFRNFYSRLTPTWHSHSPSSTLTAGMQPWFHVRVELFTRPFPPLSRPAHTGWVWEPNRLCVGQGKDKDFTDWRAPPPPRSICRTAGTTHLASFTPNKMSAEMQIDFACLWKIRIDLLDYFIPKAHACAYVPLIPTTRVPLITSFQPPLGKMHQRWKSFSTYHRFWVMSKNYIFHGAH